LNKRGGSVYFNIRGDESVIQAFLRGGECNLLYKIWETKNKSWLTWKEWNIIYFIYW